MFCRHLGPYSANLLWSQCVPCFVNLSDCASWSGSSVSLSFQHAPERRKNNDLAARGGAGAGAVSCACCTVPSVQQPACSPQQCVLPSITCCCSRAKPCPVPDARPAAGHAVCRSMHRQIEQTYTHGRKWENMWGGTGAYGEPSQQLAVRRKLNVSAATRSLPPRAAGDGLRGKPPSVTLCDHDVRACGSQPSGQAISQRLAGGCGGDFSRQGGTPRAT